MNDITQQLGRQLERVPAVSLGDLEERASLQRRVDNKYIVATGAFQAVLESLEGHEVLLIDGHRVFDYENVYFDTPWLTCFHDHVDGRRPRYKARSRWYRTTGECFFEVKVKSSDDETAKETVDLEPSHRETLTGEGRRLLEEQLEHAGIGPPPTELRPALVTAFRRVTFVAAEGLERTTVDLGVRLSAPDGPSMTMDDRHVVVETKSTDGDSRFDRLLAGAGAEPVSFSKYRLGVGTLRARGEDEKYGRGLRELFAVEDRPPPTQ